MLPSTTVVSRSPHPPTPKNGSTHQNDDAIDTNTDTHDPFAGFDVDQPIDGCDSMWGSIQFKRSGEFDSAMERKFRSSAALSSGYPTLMSQGTASGTTSGSNNYLTSNYCSLAPQNDDSPGARMPPPPRSSVDGGGTAGVPATATGTAGVVPAESPTHEEKLRYVFDELDVDGSRSLDRDEFLQLLVGFELTLEDSGPITAKEAARAYKQMDINGFGAVKYPEYLDWAEANLPVIDGIYNQCLARRRQTAVAEKAKDDRRGGLHQHQSQSQPREEEKETQKKAAEGSNTEAALQKEAERVRNYCNKKEQQYLDLKLKKRESARPLEAAESNATTIRLKLAVEKETLRTCEAKARELERMLMENAAAMQRAHASYETTEKELGDMDVTVKKLQAQQKKEATELQQCYDEWKQCQAEVKEMDKKVVSEQKQQHQVSNQQQPKTKHQNQKETAPVQRDVPVSPSPEQSIRERKSSQMKKYSSPTAASPPSLASSRHLHRSSNASSSSSSSSQIRYVSSAAELDKIAEEVSRLATKARACRHGTGTSGGSAGSGGLGVTQQAGGANTTTQTAATSGAGGGFDPLSCPASFVVGGGSFSPPIASSGSPSPSGIESPNTRTTPGTTTTAASSSSFVAAAPSSPSSSPIGNGSVGNSFRAGSGGVGTAAGGEAGGGVGGRRRGSTTIVTTRPHHHQTRATRTNSIIVSSKPKSLTVATTAAASQNINNNNGSPLPFRGIPSLNDNYDDE